MIGQCDDDNEFERKIRVKMVLTRKQKHQPQCVCIVLELWVVAFFFFIVSQNSQWNMSIQFFFQLTSTKFVCLASRTVTTACTSSINFCFSSSSKFMYHLANRVLPARFCIKIKRIWNSTEQCHKQSYSLANKDENNLF